MTDEALVTATELHRRRILRKSTAYRLARSGAIPSYTVGPKRRGVRFIVSEILEALRRQPKQESTKGAGDVQT